VSPGELRQLSEPSAPYRKNYQYDSRWSKHVINTSAPSKESELEDKDDPKSISELESTSIYREGGDTKNVLTIKSNRDDDSRQPVVIAGNNHMEYCCMGQPFCHGEAPAFQTHEQKTNPIIKPPQYSSDREDVYSNSTEKALKSVKDPSEEYKYSLELKNDSFINPNIGNSNQKFVHRDRQNYRQVVRDNPKKASSFLANGNIHQGHNISRNACLDKNYNSGQNYLNAAVSLNHATKSNKCRFNYPNQANVSLDNLATPESKFDSGEDGEVKRGITSNDQSLCSCETGGCTKCNKSLRLRNCSAGVFHDVPGRDPSPDNSVEDSWDINKLLTNPNINEYNSSMREDRQQKRVQKSEGKPFKHLLKKSRSKRKRRGKLRN